MEHSFNVEIAKKVGVNAAVLLNNIHFWVEKNKANDVNKHDGLYWTYNSKKAMTVLFPYMTERQVEYALKKLKDLNYIITGSYNKSAYDKTLWYTLTDEGYIALGEQKCSCIAQDCETDTTKMFYGINENVPPIPNSKPNNKQNNKTNTLSKDSVATNIGNFDFGNSKTNEPKKKTNDTEYLDSCLLIDNFTDNVELRNKLKELFRNKKDTTSKQHYHYSATTCKNYLNDLAKITDKIGAVNLSLQYNNTMKVMEPTFCKSNNGFTDNITTPQKRVNLDNKAKDENGNYISF